MSYYERQKAIIDEYAEAIVHGCDILDKDFIVHPYQNITISTRLDNITFENCYCFPDNYILLCTYNNLGTELSK